MKKRIRVTVLYRVIQHWRLPMFEYLSRYEDIDLKILYGADFKGTKVISAENIKTVNAKKLPTIKITKKFGYDSKRCMPFCPTLFFELLFNKTDVVITEGKSNFANAIQGFLYAKLFRKKIIWWGLGRLQNHSSTSKKEKLIQYIEKKCDAHIVYSSVGKNFYEFIGYPKERIFVAVNVVDTNKIFKIISTPEYRKIKNKKNGFNILYVGAITKNKKVDILIDAFYEFSKTHDNSTLYVVGDGDFLPKIMSRVENDNVQNIVFTGQLIEGVQNYFAIADVFVLPGLGGLAISEAMAYGVPVIASIGDGCEVDLIDTTTGFRDVSLNKDKLVEYLDILYQNPELLRKMKIASQEKILKKYNVNTYIENIYKAIQSVNKY